MPGRFVNLEVRIAGDPQATTRAAERAITSLEPDLPLDDVVPLTDMISGSLADRRLTEILLGGFALLALTLAAVGIYGVMSLFVTNRSREFGIRLAVGAEPASVLRLVLGEGLGLAVLGALLGITGALVLTRWMTGLLYEVSAADPAVFVLVPMLLVAIALLSCWPPSRRAARSDPLEALRAE
jgi:ABC-type antimicrobial peptide transport system permease subunit